MDDSVVRYLDKRRKAVISGNCVFCNESAHKNCSDDFEWHEFNRSGICASCIEKMTGSRTIDSSDYMNIKRGEKEDG